MFTQKITLMILFHVITHATSHISILNPEELIKKFNKPIKAAYSNFGNIPYGFSITGKIYYDLNNTEQDYACRPLTGFSIDPQQNIDRVPIIMVDRGSCPFVTKTRNVQNINGHLALIINSNDDPIDNILIKDDGTGSDILIPTVLISKTDGDLLKEFLTKNKNNSTLSSDIIVNIEFIIEQKDKADLNIFFSSSNKKIYKLIKDYAPFNNLIASYVNFQPHYVSHHSVIYNQNLSINQEHCIANGKYCTSPRYDLGVSNGKQILLEDLRQKCIYLINTKSSNNKENDLADYWDYMTKFYDECILGTRFNQECSFEAAEQIGIDIDSIQKCISESFKSNNKYNNSTDENSLIEEDIALKEKYRVKMFPSIMVNNKAILGAWTAKNLFEAVCAGLTNKPAECDVFKIPLGEENTDFSFMGIMTIIIFILALNIIVVLLCVKYVVKRIEQRVENADVNGRINSVVTSYLALRDVN